MRSKEELIDIAGRAMLSLSSEEIEAIYRDVSGVMGLVRAIDDVDLSLYDCSDDGYIPELREDVVVPSLSVETILSETAEKHDNFFVV